MKVLRIEDNTAQVEVGGVKRNIRLDIVDQQPDIGDYVIVHAGFAIRRIEEDEAKITLDYIKELLAWDREPSQSKKTPHH